MTSASNNRVGRSLLFFWLACAAYVVATGLLIQLFLLPRVFPSWDLGNGLMVRTDSGTFHRLAVELVERVGSEGWEAWELSPDGQTPAGVAALFYALTGPRPWVLLPLNAVLHATAAVLLAAMILRLVHDLRWALLAAIPFVLFPSALRWTAQIHKDGATILGFYMFAYALMILASPSSWFPRWRPGLRGLLLAFAGAAMVWAYRPYMSLMLQVVGLAAMVIVGPSLLMDARRGRAPPRRAWMAIALVAGMLGLLTVFSRQGTGRAGESDDDLPPLSASSISRVAWQSESWMPEPLDRMLRSLANRRQRYLTAFPEAGSLVDASAEFLSLDDVLAYIPRAAQIGLLAPFPTEWLGEGTLPSTTLMRRAAIPEMVFIYSALLALPLAIWRFRRRPDSWILLILCVGMIVGYALVVAIIGTLYRMRYPYIMLLTGISVAAVASWFDDRRRARQPPRAGVS